VHTLGWIDMSVSEEHDAWKVDAEMLRRLKGPERAFLTAFGSQSVRDKGRSLAEGGRPCCPSADQRCCMLYLGMLEAAGWRSRASSGRVEGPSGKITWRQSRGRGKCCIKNDKKHFMLKAPWK
jgi:hypothetical protein